eukprot:jgi/Ulvmu1/9897/UM057_0054.1
MPASGIRAYAEVHMEQGMVLNMAGRPIGIVRVMSGQSRLQVHVVGEQGHVGVASPIHRMYSAPSPASRASILFKLLAPLRNQSYAQAALHNCGGILLHS